MRKKISVKPYKDRDREMIREQWATLGLSEKCRYIWFYYKAYIIVGLILTAFAIFFLRDIMEKKPDEAFYVMVLDHEMDEERAAELSRALLGALELDADHAECVIETAYSGSGNMESAATVSAYMQSGRVDLVIAPEEKFNTYAVTGYFESLTSPEYEDLLNDTDKTRYFYASLADYSQGGAVRDIPFHPHVQTEASDCYGIYLPEGEFEGMVIGIMVNGGHKERVVAGMRYMLK